MLLNITLMIIGWSNEIRLLVKLYIITHSITIFLTLDSRIQLQNLIQFTSVSNHHKSNIIYLYNKSIKFSSSNIILYWKTRSTQPENRNKQITDMETNREKTDKMFI